LSEIHRRSLIRDVARQRDSFDPAERANHLPPVRVSLDQLPLDDALPEVSRIWYCAMRCPIIDSFSARPGPVSTTAGRFS
jgi:hypothetical protein